MLRWSMKEKVQAPDRPWNSSLWFALFWVSSLGRQRSQSLEASPVLLPRNNAYHNNLPPWVCFVWGSLQVLLCRKRKNRVRPCPDWNFSGRPCKCSISIGDPDSLPDAIFIIVLIRIAKNKIALTAPESSFPLRRPSTVGDVGGEQVPPLSSD